MPNHITNKLEIKGDINIINKIIGDNDCEFSFGIVVPMPKKEENNWYNWSLANWGTKWDAYEISEITRGNNFAKLSFQTAWSPPKKWLDIVMIKFPELEYVLYWSDEDFPSSGKITNDDNGYYSHDDPYAKKFVKEHFPDFYACVMEYCEEEEEDKDHINDLNKIELKTDNITL